jgi:hypothetical protein
MGMAVESTKIRWVVQRRPACDADGQVCGLERPLVI